MKKFVSIMVIFAIIAAAFAGAIPAFAQSQGTVSIELDVSAAQVGDLINATIRVQNVTSASFIFTPIYFNPNVVQVVDSDGNLVYSEVKTAAQVEGGNIGLTLGQALSGETDADWNPIFWNGSFFINPFYPEIDNENGFVRLGFGSFNDTTIVNETFVTVHFIAVGEGDAEIRFATQADGFVMYDVNYSVFPDDLGSAVPGFPQTSFQPLTIASSDEPFEMPQTQQPTEPSGNDEPITTVTIAPPNVSGDILDYTISQRMIENNVARAFGVTEMSMNIRVETDLHIRTIVLRMPVSAVMTMIEGFVFWTEFTTPLGVIGFEHLDVFENMTASSQYVIATISENESSVTIDGIPMVTGGSQPSDVEIPADALGHWAEDYIRFVVENGIMVGFPNGTFAPNGGITRAEFSTAFSRLLGISDGDATFEDTDEHWARGYIAAMADLGIVGGVGDGLFAPDAPITREQIAAILDRTFRDGGEVNVENLFADDAEISDWARESVYATRDAGIMQGTADGNFNPRAGATRAEIAAILTRLVRVVG